MALGVLSDVGQQAYDGGGQALSSDLPRFCESGCVEGSRERLRVMKNCVHRCEQFFPGGTRLVFAPQKLHLLVRKRFAAQVSHKPVRATRDVPQVKSNRAETMRSCPYLLGRQALGVTFKVFSGLLKPE